MINKKKGMVLFLIAFMLASIALVPTMPKTAAVVEPTSFSPSSAPLQEDTIDRIVETLGNEELMAERLDPLLSDYMNTGEISGDLALSSKGEVQAILYIEPQLKISAIRALADVSWTFDAKLLKVVHVKVSSPAKLKMLSELPGVRYLGADRLFEEEPYSTDYDSEADGIDSYVIRDVVGATDVWDSYEYDGSGVIVGFKDGGIDFSSPDMEDAIAVNETGYPMSYDPSGWSIQLMTIANNSYVENTTAWLEAGYLLTYENDSKYYLNVTGWDPLISDTGYSYDNLFAYYFDYYASVLGWANFTDFKNNVLWKDWEIPAPSPTYNYTTGWLYQRRDADASLRTRLLAPALIMNNSKLVFDFNASRTFSHLHNSYYFSYLYGYDLAYNVSETADRETLAGWMDWSFVDDWDDGYVFEVNGKNVVAADLNNDGVDDWGLGSFCWAYDAIDYHGLVFNHTIPGTPVEQLFCGMRSDGLGYALLFPVDIQHGQWTGATVGSRGVLDHDVHEDGNPVKLPGVAPGTTLISCQAFSGGSALQSEFWAAGFHLAADGNWTYTGQHKAHIHSNSWGYSWLSYVEQSYLGVIWDMMAVPGFIDAEYPGTLFFFSAGNSGPGYMTTGPPGTSPSVICVGGTWITHTYDEVGWYGPNLSYNQESPGASKGPSYIGLSKPDVLAPYGFGVNPFSWDKPEFGDTSYYWWTGTSLACPIAAGVAAIALEAIWEEWGDSNWYDPLVLGEIIQSTATDIGYDPYYQGNGFVNAKAAVDAIAGEGDELYFNNVDSFNNWAEIMNETWQPENWGFYNGSAPIAGVWVDASMNSPPMDYGMANLYFGNVYGGDSATVTMTAYDYAGTKVSIGDLDDADAYHYLEKNVTTFDVLTYMYNDTNWYDYNASIGNPHYGTFNLTAYMDDTFAGQWSSATMATIAAHDTAGNVAGGIRLFDWNDTVADGVMNYYNATEDNDYVKLLTRCDYGTYNQYVKVAHPDGLGTLFDYWPLLQIYDSGHTVHITIVLWELVDDAKMGFAENGDDIDVTLTLPADVEPGIHAGFIYIENGAYTHNLPYSYMAGYEMGGDIGEELVVVDGWGDEHEAYDSGVIHPCVSGTAYPEYGQRNILLNIPDDYPTKNRTVLVAKVEWDNPDTIVDLYIKPTGDSFFSQYVGTDEATFAPNEPTQSTIIYDFEGLMNDTYYLHYECSTFSGATFMENVTITLQWYNESLPTPTCDLTWWSKWDSTPQTFGTNSTLAGDHVSVQGEWTDLSVTGLPEYDITRTEVEFLSGLYVERTGAIVEPDFENWPFAPDFTDTYALEIVEGIGAGDNVRITCTMDAHDTDPAVIVYEWVDGDFGEQLIIIDDGTTGDLTEAGSFIAASDMDLAICIYSFYYVYPGAGQGDYHLILDSRRSDTKLVTGDTVDFDTYVFLQNITKEIRVYGYTDTNVEFATSAQNVFLGNFFAPHVEVLTPNGGEDWSTGTHNITWTAYDNNSDDTLTYTVLFSRDGGDSWQLLAGGLTDTYYEWETDPFLEGDEWFIEVRAFDNDTVYCGMQNPLDPWIVIAVPGGDQTYANLIGFDFDAFVQNDWPNYMGYDRSDASFKAGSVTTPPTTTTTPETTTTTTTTTPAGIDPLIIGLIGGIGAGIVVVLILFLVKRK